MHTQAHHHCRVLQPCKGGDEGRADGKRAEAGVFLYSGEERGCLITYNHSILATRVYNSLDEAGIPIASVLLYETTSRNELLVRRTSCRISGRFLSFLRKPSEIHTYTHQPTCTRRALFPTANNGVCAESRRTISSRPPTHRAHDPQS